MSKIYIPVNVDRYIIWTFMLDASEAVGAILIGILLLTTMEVLPENSFVAHGSRYANDTEW